MRCGEGTEQLPGDVALERSHDLLRGAAFGSSARDVSAGGRIDAQADDSERRLALKRVLCPEASPTSGEHRPLIVIAPVGSLFNPGESGALLHRGVVLGPYGRHARARTCPGAARQDASRCGGDLVHRDVWMTNPETNRTYIFGDTGGIGTGGLEGHDVDRVLQACVVNALEPEWHGSSRGRMGIGRVVTAMMRSSPSSMAHGE